MAYFLSSHLNLINTQILKKAQKIKILIFDVDGVLTDGSLFYNLHDVEIKKFNVLDGLGIQLIQLCNIKTAIITTRKSASVLKRAQDLNITHIFQNIKNKLIAFQELLSITKLVAINACYIGDDLIDLPILHRVGFSVSVINGHQDIKTRVDYITKSAGGYGAVREICDLLLHAQGNYERAISQYLI